MAIYTFTHPQKLFIFSDSAHMTVHENVSACEGGYVNVIHSHVSKQSKFPAITLTRLGFSSLRAAVSGSPRCVRGSRPIPCHDSARWGSCVLWVVRRRKGKEKEDGRVFALQQLLFSPHSPRASHTSWKSLNYAASMTQRSKWLSDETGCVLWRSFSARCHQTCCQPGMDFCIKSQFSPSFIW